MKVLALDLGMRKTGVALGDTVAETIVALTTITHASTEECLDALRPLVKTHRVEVLVVGLPLLPSGEEGAQAMQVRDMATRLEKEFSLPLVFIDERFTSSSRFPCKDADAMAACTILEIALPKLKESI